MAGKPSHVGKKQQAVHEMVLVLKRKFLQKGVLFDTKEETNCEVVTPPDPEGNFTAFDSDHVERQFNIEIVTKLHL